MSGKSLFVSTLAMLGLTTALPASAQKQYDPGASDTEIRIGQTMPYSGPASALSTIGKVQAAYFKKINGEGGINGRKINLLSLDDAYNPAKTVEAARRLVERDQVLFLFQPLGSLTDNTNVYGYAVAQTLVQVLRQAGDHLTRANIMKQAASLKDFRIDIALPGIRLNTSASDLAPIQSMQLVRFDGREWKAFGEILSR